MTNSCEPSGLFVVLLQMFGEFTIALRLGGVMEFGDITKYTRRHIENFQGCKSKLVNYNAIVKAVTGQGYTVLTKKGYTVQRLWYLKSLETHI